MNFLRQSKKIVIVIISIFLFSSLASANDEVLANEDRLIKLYVATFNRAPDYAGLNYWLGEMKKGWSIEMVAESMFMQPETMELYQNFQTDNFINSVYQNILTRDADEGGINYWKSELDNNKISKEHFIIAIINGATGGDAKILNNKTSVGRYFAIDENKNDLNLSKLVMKIVTAEINSVKVAKDKIVGKESFKPIIVSYGNRGEVNLKWWKSGAFESKLYISLSNKIDENSQLITSKVEIGNYNIVCKPTKNKDDFVEYNCGENEVMIVKANHKNYLLLEKEDKIVVVGTMNILQVQNKK